MIKSGNVVSACTLGMLYSIPDEIVLVPSPTLLNSPAQILTEYLEQEGLVSKPTDRADWPMHVGYHPKDVDSKVPANSASIFDTPGLKDTRLMDGEPIIKYGIQITIRSRDYNTGWVKLESLYSQLDGVASTQLVFDTYTYSLVNVSRAGSALPLGPDGTDRMYRFVVNFLLTVHRLI
jgi:hypothetical protein